MLNNDPIGKAILDFAAESEDANIIVESDIMEDDVIPVKYLFRSFETMPEIERVALKSCKGNVLDVGAAAGPHTSWLRSNDYNVTAIDTSKGAIHYLNQKFPDSSNLCLSINDLSSDHFKFDTIILLMNGIGLAGDLSKLVGFLKHLKSLLSEEGKILCDSVDVSYFYEDTDGAMWVDLNSEYQGDFKFKMHYKDQATDWFNWLYVDKVTLSNACEDVGLDLAIMREEDDSYLAELTIKK
jgi:hypothetical protein